ncbi:protein-tyrosine sulfotransferase 1-like [Littorina saxatilis]|uniref:Protein-tyrosine sulfotransferase n=1 Tax=Littorina saxatilis TaxID=31220 RepID=A0AAN9AI31_9CAEN
MGLCRQSTKRKLLLCGLAVTVLYFFYISAPCDQKSQYIMVPKEKNHFIYDSKNRAIPYGEDMEIIFVGGMPRSGTTLMRVMLDAHPDVRCGEETRVIPRILGLRTQWEKSAMEKKRLEAAGVTGEVLDSAVRAFILEVVAKHGEAAPRLCNKDPFTLKSAIYLSHQFPRSRFVFMVRDGRAVVHSIITRKVTISGFDLKSYRNCLQKWSSAMENMYSQCLRVGPSRCMPVYYEQLALHPREWMMKIVKFLDLPWNETVLHHEDFIGDKISLSRTEKSTDQVIKPVNVEALSKWVGNIPDDVVKDMHTIAPMLMTLGYDPHANPPNYGKPDAQVADNTLHIKANADFWKQKEKDIFDHLGGRPDFPELMRKERQGMEKRPAVVRTEQDAVKESARDADYANQTLNVRR